MLDKVKVLITSMSSSDHLQFTFDLMTLTQNFNISYFKQKDQIDHKVSQSVTECHIVSQSSLITHLEMVVGGGGGWKPILVYSSGPTFELELESEFDLT